MCLLLKVLLHIINNNIIPIFLLIALGYVLNKRFDMDIKTLSKANNYIFVPILVFTNLYATPHSPEVLKVALFAALVLGFKTC